MNEFLQAVLFTYGDYELKVLNLILIGIALIFFRILAVLSKRYLHQYLLRFKIQQGNEKVIRRFVRSVIYALGIMILIACAGLSVSNILSFTLLKAHKYEITVANIVSAVIIISISRFVVWFVMLGLQGYYNKEKYDVGTQFAINQILKYLIYTIATLTAIQALGFNLTVIWGGAAALLVGFGLGMQHTFNDLVSGIFMLIERGVHVGDILEVDGKIGKVKKIGIRASQIVTRDNVVILVPNSKLVTEAVTNWSHNEEDIRFRVNVGVAYGSDTVLVKRLLDEVAKNHPSVLQEPKPIVRFTGFGDSSLDFELLFWATTNEFVVIEDIRSDLHFGIDAAFRANNVTIPFPQRDIWVRNSQ